MKELKKERTTRISRKMRRNYEDESAKIKACFENEENARQLVQKRKC